MANMKLQIKDC